MRTIVLALLLAAVQAAQLYPPPFPRPGATRLLDHERVTVWEYTAPPKPVTHRHAHDAVGVWIEGQTPHAVWIARGTTHTGDMAGASRATIFELK